MADNLLSTFLPDKAATGFFPQMRPRRRSQDREGSANVPIDVLRGRLAGMLGTPTDLANMLQSPMPTEMFGDTNYELAQQLPYGSEYFLKNLPLAPTSRVGEVAGKAGSFVPLNPMPAARAAAAGARMAGQGVMAAGQAGERFAERVVPQIMERGGLGAEMLQGMSRGTVSPLDVYHGSPHRFPPTATNPLGEFDASKIGTGEGAQAYGHGLYLAESPAVSQGYADQISAAKGQKWELDGVKISKPGDAGSRWSLAGIDWLNRSGFDKARAIENIKADWAISGYSTKGKDFKELKQWIDDVDVSKITKDQSLYKVDLPDEQIAKMLDWDKPLSEQGENIRLLFPKMGTPASKALRKEAEGQKIIADSLYASGDKEGAMAAMQKRSLLEARRQAGLLGETQGQDAYKALMTAIGENPIQLTSTQGSFGTPAIAQHLRELGIPGIKYLDATSRDAGKGTRNFVVFPGEEKSLTILERNGQPGQNSLNSFIR